jgi:arsenate reductase
MKNILFLCKGNVGRSQMAEGLFNHLYSEKGPAFSAGIHLSGPEQTLESLRPGTDNVIAVMQEEDIDVSEKKRELLTDYPSPTEDPDLRIIYINTGSLPEALQNDPRVEQWSIEDPKGMNLDDTRKIKDLIKEKVIKLGVLL